MPRKRRAFSAAFESAGSSTGPTQRIAFGIGDRDGRVVKGRVNVRDTAGNVAAYPFLLVGLCHGKVLLIELVG